MRPAVGDWVTVQIRPDGQNALIQTLLERKSGFTRKVAGVKTEEQVVAANVDTVFLVSGLDGDFNVRRLERYLTTAWQSGASPVVVLNKADLCEDIDSRLVEVEEVAMGLPIHTVSAISGDSVEDLRAYLTPGKTVAFLGSSGVGKSSLINSLLGEERLDTGAVREDDSRGRHTTTSRHLIPLPEGGLVIDTPGMREMQLWADEEALEHVFEEIETLAEQCRFRDCQHIAEPGCAVLAAIEDGSLPRKRYDSYLKLRKEIRYLESRQNVAGRRQQEREWGKKIREYFQFRREVLKKDLKK